MGDLPFLTGGEWRNYCDAPEPVTKRSLKRSAMTDLYLIAIALTAVLFLLREPILDAMYWNCIATKRERQLHQASKERMIRTMEQVNQLMDRPLIDDRKSALDTQNRKLTDARYAPEEQITIWLN
jgi:hypothetical protein